MNGERSEHQPSSDSLRGATQLCELVPAAHLLDLVNSWSSWTGLDVRIINTSSESVVATAGAHPLAPGSATAAESNAELVVLEAAEGRHVITRIQSDGQPLGVLVVGPIARSIDDQQAIVATRGLLSTLALLVDKGQENYLTRRIHLAAMEDGYAELRSKKQRLLEANAKLRELDRLKSNLLSTVSHELRTPLMSMLGFAELLEELLPDLRGEAQDRAAAAEYTETIAKRGRHLLGLINRLIDLSKSESTKLQLSKVRFPLRELASLQDAALRQRARELQIELTFDCEAPTTLVTADEALIREATTQLIDNALKFTPRGGRVRVLTRTRRESADGEVAAVFAASRTRVDVMVEDDGIGIDPDHRERVFDPFYQADASDTRTFEGLGVGLTLARRIAEAHDGNLELLCKPGPGCAFLLSLPHDPSEADDAQPDDAGSP